MITCNESCRLSHPRGPERPLYLHGNRLQSQVAALYAEATVHRKRVRSWVRRAIRGENVVTTIDGAKETEYTVVQH